MSLFDLNIIFLIIVILLSWIIMKEDNKGDKND